MSRWVGIQSRKPAFSIISDGAKSKLLSRRYKHSNNYCTISLVGRMNLEEPNLLDAMFGAAFPKCDLNEVQGGEIWGSITDATRNYNGSDFRFILLASKVGEHHKDKIFRKTELFKACMSDVFIISKISTEVFDLELKTLFKNCLDLFGKSRIDKLNCHDHRALLIVVLRDEEYNYQPTKTLVNNMWKECANTIKLDKFFVLEFRNISTQRYITDIGTLRQNLISHQLVTSQCQFKISIENWLQNASQCWKYLSKQSDMNSESQPPPYEFKKQTNDKMQGTSDLSLKLLAEFIFPIFGYNS